MDPGLRICWKKREKKNCVEKCFIKSLTPLVKPETRSCIFNKYKTRYFQIISIFRKYKPVQTLTLWSKSIVEEAITFMYLLSLQFSKIA